jgi:hypothetical protein
MAAVLALVAVSIGVGASVQAVDVTGDWAFDVQTGQGAGNPAITFTQKGEAITGTYVGTFGSAALRGTVKGTAIEFSFEAEMQGQKIDNVYQGTVEQDTMTGSVAIAGGQLSGTFTAKRK